MKPSRAERAAEAARLNAQGLNGLEIAAAMGVSRSYAYGLLTDPTGEHDRVRKLRYARACVDCGATINTDGRATEPATRCVPCSHEDRKRQSREWFLESVREWVELFGSPPSAMDWSPALARMKGSDWKAERYEQTGRPWPSPTLVIGLYGSWNAGLNAAGYPPVKPGEYRDGRAVWSLPERWPAESIVAAACDWWRSTGSLPSSYSWRAGADDHPSANTVFQHFGTWAAFLDEVVAATPDEAVAA